MIKKSTIIPTVLAAALLAICLPTLAAAQGGYDPWGRPDYRRDRDNRRDRDDLYGRYDRRALRDSVNRVKDKSKDFQRRIDSALDRSRYDGSRREDRINEVAKDFRRAAEDLKDRFNDGRDLNRSASEARRLLQIGSNIERFMARNRLDSRIESDWAQIRQGLRVIADAYGYSYAGYDDGYYRRNDGYGRRNEPWWRRFPN
ncbi:MAG TPA: hypothetical protein VD966_03665 [Pyrinomonadaceae bacterium]|nr:hypothetical protein [Pyrinomonadaceae bacterium]